jgi:hypothetical protein
MCSLLLRHDVMLSIVQLLLLNYCRFAYASGPWHERELRRRYKASADEWARAAPQQAIMQQPQQPQAARSGGDMAAPAHAVPNPHQQQQQQQALHAITAITAAFPKRQDAFHTIMQWLHSRIPYALGLQDVLVQD